MDVSTVVAQVRVVQGVLQALSALQLTGVMFPPQATVTNGSSYDYIVVDGGSGGSVIANRLTEQANVSVLLLEAGGNPPIESVLSGIFPLLSGSVHDYAFLTENNGVTGQNLISQAAHFTAGKMLGGSSSLNHLSYTRGNRIDYDSWAEKINDDSWTYDGLLQYFLKAEAVQDAEILNSSSGQYHGTDGYIKMERQPSAKFILRSSEGTLNLSGIFPLLSGSVHDYAFLTENNGVTGQNLISQAAHFTAGKMLGGSSSLNHLSYTRGNRIDYDSWAEKINDDSWTYDGLLQYFLKAEAVQDAEILNSSSGQYHGTDGYIKMERQPSASNEFLFEGFTELGLDYVLDINDPNFSQGISSPLLTIGDGRRQSTAQAYLGPIFSRPNLHVFKNARATKVLFDANNNAIGVEAITNDGDTLTLNAEREVILSAGAIQTPQILMLSGIGPSDHLSSFNIPVISDLPVGQNLFDHTPAIVAVKLQEPIPVTASLDPRVVPVPLTLGFAALNRSQSYADYNTINLLIPANNPSLIQLCSVVLYYDNAICQSLADGAAGSDTLLSVVNILKPLSRGEVLLRSTNPEDPPLINHGIYTNEQDVTNMALYLRDFASIVNTTAFQNLNAELVDIDLPECNDLPRNSTEYWRCYAISEELGSSVG